MLRFEFRIEQFAHWFLIDDVKEAAAWFKSATIPGAHCRSTQHSVIMIVDVGGGGGDGASVSLPPSLLNPLLFWDIDFWHSSYGVRSLEIPIEILPKPRFILSRVTPTTPRVLSFCRFPPFSVVSGKNDSFCFSACLPLRGLLIVVVPCDSLVRCCLLPWFSSFSASQRRRRHSRSWNSTSVTTALVGACARLVVPFVSLSVRFRIFSYGTRSEWIRRRDLFFENFHARSFIL